MLKFSEKFRPKTLDEIVGQSSLLRENLFIKKAIENKNIPHIFIYGPPGVGKTSFSYIIAESLNFDFFSLNASSLSIKEIRDIIEPYKNYKKKPLIFIDEIHRLNSSQQEVLLPIMEFNKALIIGASTQNLYNCLRDAILSRGIVLKFNKLSDRELGTLLNRVIKELDINLEESAKEYLIKSAFGDARRLLIHLEIAYNTSKIINLELLKSIKDENLYENIEDSSSSLTSAMIKSIRGSDPDAAMFYMIQLLEKREKPEYIARRLVILASEDIGNANPNALNLAVSTMHACKEVGYPESKYMLTQCVTYLASCPKSNSVVLTLRESYDFIKNNKMKVPDHLKLHNAKDYKNPHDYKNLKQKYTLRPIKLLKLKGIAFEKTLRDWLDKLNN